ncbi:MAG TPA: PAS domain-containing protein [Baekduia sp.]|jgi:PAS domain-containing protein
MDRQPPHPPAEASLADILDLFEEHVYAGEVTPEGSYVDHRSGLTIERFIGGPVPPGVARGQLWESLIHADDIAGYHAFNRSLLACQDGEATYRLVGLDGATRILWDRARSTRNPDGSVLVQGIISDVTEREEADARAAEAADRFSSLLDVVGEHVYVTLASPDGSMTELFQGPGAERLMGGAEPDAEMENWERAVHPDDRAAYTAFNAALVAGDRSDLEYRLIGADGITRWVHDRAAPRRRRADGSVEISGIVADVTDRWRMRAELAAAHAAVSRVVEAMDDHLYTLEVDPRGGHRTVYRGPHRERLIGGRSPAATRTTASGSPCCTPRTASGGGPRWRGCRPVARWRSSTASRASMACSGSCSTSSVPAAAPTARSSTTPSRATSPSAGGWRASCAAAWPRCSRPTPSWTPRTARQSCGRGPTS